MWKIDHLKVRKEKNQGYGNIQVPGMELISKCMVTFHKITRSESQICPSFYDATQKGEASQFHHEQCP